jgi:uncharacterized protein YabE (DUF348 family)
MNFSKRTRRIVLGVLSVAILVTVAFIVVPKKVTLSIDGESETIKTNAFTVAGVLEQKDIPLREADAIAPLPNSWLWGGEEIDIRRARYIHIHADDETKTLFTPERVPVVLLAEAGINLNADDQLLADGVPIPIDEPLSAARNHSLQIRRVAQINVEVGPQTETFRSAASTLGQALWEQGIRLYNGDQLSPSPEAPVHGGQIQAKLVRSQELIIQVQEQTIHTRSIGPTVGAALAKTGLGLQGLDYSIPAEGEPLPEDGAIELVRVREQVTIEQDLLPFSVTQQPLPDVPIDTTQVVQAGEYGLTAKRVRVVYENRPEGEGWEEVDRQVEDEWVAREPQPRVNGYGTKIEIKTINTPNGPIEYWRAVDVYASTYSPCRLGVPDYCSSTTSSGKELQKGMIATTLEWYLYMKGMPVYVPDYGFATIEDVGGGLPDRHWIDLGYSEEDWVGWAGWTTIYFLTPVPNPDNILYVLEYGG